MYGECAGIDHVEWQNYFYLRSLGCSWCQDLTATFFLSHFGSIHCGVANYSSLAVQSGSWTYLMIICLLILFPNQSSFWEWGFKKAEWQGKSENSSVWWFTPKWLQQLDLVLTGAGNSILVLHVGGRSPGAVPVSGQLGAGAQAEQPGQAGICYGMPTLEAVSWPAPSPCGTSFFFLPVYELVNSLGVWPSVQS